MIKISKAISLILVVLIVFAYPVNAYASEVQAQEYQFDCVITLGDVMIGSYENELGDSFIYEFINGELTQRNTILHNQPGVVYRDYFDQDGSVRMASTMYASDYGISRKTKEITTFAMNAYSSFGEIQYRVVGYEGYEYYTQVVRLSQSTREDDYTLDSWKGTVVDLIGILVSAGIGAAGVVTGYVNNLLLATGVYVVGGVIKDAITTTVVSRKTEFTWQLMDTVFENDAYVSGSKHVITESGDNYGEVYYNGITPRDWGTMFMANSFYNVSYAFSNWTVNKWTLKGGNTNV